jgi:hypothetical protein
MTTVTLVEDPDTGELIMPIPDKMWEELGWDIGDTVVWTVHDNGTLTLHKKENE